MQGNASWLTRVALITSALTLAFGLVRRIIFKILYSEKRIDDAREEIRAEMQLTAFRAAPGSPIINPQLTEKYPQSVVSSSVMSSRETQRAMTTGGACVPERSVAGVTDISPVMRANTTGGAETTGYANLSNVEPEIEQKSPNDKRVASEVEQKEVNKVEASAADSLSSTSLSLPAFANREVKVEVNPDEKHEKLNDQGAEEA